MQDLVSQLRNELLTQFTSIKKDLGTKQKKKEDELKKKSQETHFEQEKILEETKANRDKI